MIEDHFLVRWGYLALAGIASAITALSMTQWKSMTRTEMGLTAISSFSFAVFVGPWFAIYVLKIGNLTGVAAIVYVFGAGSQVLLPKFIKWVARPVDGGTE